MIDPLHNPDEETLDEASIDRDPITLFDRWFKDAQTANLLLPEAMTLATVNSDGRPTARMVLLKQVDHDGFVFFTNYSSSKASQLDENDAAALVFHWAPVERQVRVEGRVVKTSADESRAYFQTRPRESQIGAWASPQSEVIESRSILEQRKAQLEEKYRDRPIDCPPNWGGYRLIPDRIEFWKGRIGRLHDRILYSRTAEGGWTIQRLAP
ncbi:MAG TPA: pyridoxamine 5'-phosphate oxidase [Pyrinomonadaceae bacterium]|nr:pyridoxamine 5'-phosphate oxidase [Pyrinomonadaceae bacterium]